MPFPCLDSWQASSEYQENPLYRVSSFKKCVKFPKKAPVLCSSSKFEEIRWEERISARMTWQSSDGLMYFSGRSLLVAFSRLAYNCDDDWTNDLCTYGQTKNTPYLLSLL